MRFLLLFVICSSCALMYPCDKSAQSKEEYNQCMAMHGSNPGWIHSQGHQANQAAMQAGQAASMHMMMMH